MNALMSLYVFILFFVLTPGVLLSLPPKSSKLVVAATHALVFTLVYWATHKIVWKFTTRVFEGLENKEEQDEQEEQEEKPRQAPQPETSD